MATLISRLPIRPEADVTINGIKLTHGQSMTLRVALSSFLMNMIEDPYTIKHLGSVRQGYIARGREVEQLMVGGQQ
jgi:hypothetical protein